MYSTIKDRLIILLGFIPRRNYLRGNVERNTTQGETSNEEKDFWDALFVEPAIK
jgi:hypothetical protein